MRVGAKPQDPVSTVWQFDVLDEKGTLTTMPNLNWQSVLVSSEHNWRRIVRALRFAWSLALLALALLLAFLPVLERPVLGAGASLTLPAPESRAKNIILFIGDGMGFNHTEATSYWATGQQAGLTMQQCPFQLACSTYPARSIGYDPDRAWEGAEYVKLGATDSAAAATALACGIKTYNAALGVDFNGKPRTNVLERAERWGKATGVVSTVPFSHATPAGFVAHQPRRNDYHGIAEDMLCNSAADVIIGAGHPWYDKDHKKLDTAKFTYISEATWGKVMAGAAGADANGDGSPDPWTFLEETASLKALGSGPTPERVFGLVEVGSTTQQGRSGDANALPFVAPLTADVPTLKDLTLAAINVLDEDPDGFVLMVEGGAIDWASHSNQTGRMIEETLDFDKAIQAAFQWVEANGGWEENLIIITADHECGGLGKPDSQKGLEPVINRGEGQAPGLQWYSGGHTNSLVPVYAKGAGAELLKLVADQEDSIRGAYLDNTEIPLVMTRAMGPH